MRGRAGPVYVLAALVLLVSAQRRVDPDFEFADAEPQQQDPWQPGATQPDSAWPVHMPTSRPRYLYENHNLLCREVSCKKREVCVVRASQARCVPRRELRRARVGAGGEDMGYSRCMGCGVGKSGRGQFLCGSDNRTYSSPCRLELHNCVRRPTMPVTRACRGFCPCRTRAKPDPADNEVLPPEPDRPTKKPAQSECSLQQLADRLLDWFSVLMQESDMPPPPPFHGFPADCKPEVRWMFDHLDTDGDGVLSAQNLYALRHDDRERCLRPFLSSCGAGDEGGVSRSTWCGCVRRAVRPCSALARAVRTRAGGYVPACDAEGYYRPRQCHAALGVCWCVDRHGVERPGSRGKGSPRCEPNLLAESGDVDDEDDDAGAGSGEGELRY